MSVSTRPGNNSGTSYSNSGISLKSVLSDANFLNGKDIRFKSCTADFQETKTEDLFVAMIGPDDDGHEDALAAVRRGAKAIVCERLLPVTVPQCIVPDSRIAFGQICQALAGEPCRLMKTIAVAGTDGKTTTAHLLASVFEQAGRSAGLLSSIDPGRSNNSTKTRKKANLKTNAANDNRPSNSTNATAPQLANSLARMVMDGNDVGVIEVDSVQLAQHQVAGTQLDVAIVNNVRGNHFGFHSSLANYRRSQFRLLDYLKPSGVAVINVDDPGCHFAMESIECPTLTFGMKQQADVTASIVESDLYETTFTIAAGNETAMVRTKISGRHHIYNCLATTAAALVHGIDLATIVRGLERVESLPGRMNVLKCGQKFSLAVDESTSPYRLGVALNTLQQNTSGKVYCVFSTPDGIDNQTAGQFGRIAERHSAVPVITRSTANGNSALGERTEYEPFHQVLDGFERPARARAMPDRIAAIEWALSQAKPGDAVLIAGRGAQPIASLSAGKWQLSDIEVCQSWLYGDSVPGQTIPTTVTPPAIFNIENYRPC